MIYYRIVYSDNPNTDFPYRSEELPEGELNWEEINCSKTYLGAKIELTIYRALMWNERRLKAKRERKRNKLMGTTLWSTLKHD